jgi:manganese-dependent ADP-ribose/CDP-alcohol diphosphatase
MRIGIIADCQYADFDSPDLAPQRKYRMSTNKLQQAITFFNSQDLDFVIHLGDLIDQNKDSFKHLMPILNTSRHKIYHLLGNHDFYPVWPEQEIRNNHQELLKILNMPSKYYSLITDEFVFLFLDTNEVGVIEWNEGTKEYLEGELLISQLRKKGYINAQTWNGALSSAQLGWIEQQIKMAAKSDLRVILCGHHPVFPSHRENLLNSEKVLEIISNYPEVVMYLNGHNHDGNYGEYRKVPCITFFGMVDTNENSYAVLELSGNKGYIKGYGREINREIKLR